MTATRTSEATALRDAVLASGSVRVEFAVLWLMWCRVAPRFVGDRGQAAALHDALLALVGQGVIELPKGAWDTSTVPPLPRFVTVPGARRKASGRPWLTFPWRSELGWVASLRALPEPLFADLVAINDWLARTAGRELPVVPVRYRSAEIFGREKRLDQLLDTTLFAQGRLSLGLLSSVQMAPPIPAAAVGVGDDILVVENSATYWVAVEALRHVRGHTIGAVGWGSGKAFPAQVSSLTVDIAGQGPLRGVVWYWGDYDPPGTATAATAARMTEEVDVRPATDLWAAMAGLPAQDVGTVSWAVTAEGSGWLGGDLWDRLAYVRTAGGRIAQELVPVDVVAAWAERISQGKSPHQRPQGRVSGARLPANGTGLPSSEQR